MNYQSSGVFAGAVALVVCGTWTGQAYAQAEVKEKPPMYSYVANWVIPRAQWAELEKGRGDSKIYEKALSSGTLVGYGNDTTLVHSADGPTHDNWWSSMSMAGLLSVLDDLHKAPPAPVLNSATKHWDHVYVSRYYNWHAGSYKGAYTREATYKLKPDANSDALDLLAKQLIVPLLEKLLADGTLLEYEIDEEAVHTQSTDMFWIISISKSAAGQDKLDNAIRETLKASPLAGPAFGSMVDFSAHRDDLAQTEATFK